MVPTLLDCAITSPIVISSTGWVWASWNGSTDVAAWRVLAGPDASHLSAVGGSRPKQGFQTKILLDRAYPKVAVQALSARGRVLGMSKTISPTGQ